VADNAPPTIVAVGFADASREAGAAKAATYRAAADTSGFHCDPKRDADACDLLATMLAIGEAVQLWPEDVGISCPVYHGHGSDRPSWLGGCMAGTPAAVMSPLAVFLDAGQIAGCRRFRKLSRHHRWRAECFAYELCVRKIADKGHQVFGPQLVAARREGRRAGIPETLEYCGRFCKLPDSGVMRSFPSTAWRRLRWAVTVPPLKIAGGDIGANRVGRETVLRARTRGACEPRMNRIVGLFLRGRPATAMKSHRGMTAATKLADRVEGFLWLSGGNCATAGYLP